MFRVTLIAVLLGLIFCVLPSKETLAQQSDEMGVVYESARNKIGLIRYCRNNALLDADVADQAVSAVQAGLPVLPANNPLYRENGDRAQNAGEDGFLDAGRRRDITSIARLFRTTPTELCQEWADETLRAQDSPRGGPGTAITLVKPAEPVPPAQPIVVRIPPARAIQAERTARADPVPPMPEKAPGLPARTEFASLQNGPPSDALPAVPGGGAVSEQVSGTTASAPAAPQQPSLHAMPTLARLFNWGAKPLPAGPTATPAVLDFCLRQRQICRKVCNLRFRDDFVGCPQTCESRAGRCTRTGCYKWREPELVFAEKFGGYQCVQ